MRIFLKAKSWQLFVLLIGIPMLLQIALVAKKIVQVYKLNKTEYFESIFYDIFLIAIIKSFFVLGYLVWVWSVVIWLQNKIPNEFNIKIIWFKFVFTFLILFEILKLGFKIYLYNLINDGFFKIDNSNNMVIGIFESVFLFYFIYFAAKTYKKNELKRKVRINDFIGEFFLFLFYPIGIWILQPKINKMVEE